jgi:hypothetical protein
MRYRISKGQCSLEFYQGAELTTEGLKRRAEFFLPTGCFELGKLRRTTSRLNLVETAVIFWLARRTECSYGWT